MTQDGSDLFQIRRIFSFPTPSATSNGSIPALKIASMAFYTLEKKQLLALAVCEECPKTEAPSNGDGLPTDSADAKTNFLLLRTIEEDQRARFWRIPVCSTLKQQKAGKAERLAALDFSPEGDWLAALSQRKNRLHLVPVLKLVANQRRAMLDASYQPTSHHRELMSVHQAAMTIQMASYLRATNEFGGINGARYHSQVAGDDEQISTLEFAPGIGTITCVRWWRSLNGKNYCLVGGTESLISIVNVEENAEECRCELVNAGAIVSIDLLQEKFKKERRTSMLVKTTTSNEMDTKEKQAGGRGIRYYRVVLEKKFQQRPNSFSETRKPNPEDDKASSIKSTLKIETTTGETPSCSDTQFTTTPSIGAATSSPLAKTPPTFVVKTFPQHFLEDLDFRPQRIKKNASQVCLYPINGVLSSESSLAMYDTKTKKAVLYSNFHWRLKGEYEIPDLLPSSKVDNDKDSETKSSEEDSSSRQQAEGANANEKDQVVDVELTYCSTDLMLLQGRTSTSNQTISTWISLPSHQGMDEDVVKAHIVHYLTLHGNEKVACVLQSTAPSRGQKSHPSGASSFHTTQSSDAEIIYILQTTHHVYECRPQWSRLALFKALGGQTIALRDALSIGYALGIDMASLCQVVADTLYTSVINGSVTATAQLVRWVRDLLEVSRVMPSQALELLVAMGGVDSAIEYAQHVLSKPVRDAVSDGFERQRVALLLVELVFQRQLQHRTSLRTEGDEEEQEAWLIAFLTTNRDYVTEDMVDLCLSQHHVDKAILIATERDQVPQVLEKIVQKGLASSISDQLVQSLLTSGHAAALTCPSSRLILRSFPVETQAQVLVEYPPALLQQRDWLDRNLQAISPDLCHQIAAKIDPTQENTFLATVEESEAKLALQSDVSTSEFIPASREEQVELYLTLLLRLNWDHDEETVNDVVEEANRSTYSQAQLEKLLKDWATQYRPPIMVARCVDYGNWTAAACIYEAHGELVEALECRLHSQNAHSALSAFTSLKTTQTDVESCQQMRKELLDLLTSLVVQSHCSKLISEQVRAAILARILVKWFDYGLDRAVLEEFLLDPDVFTHVSSLLAQIFFSEIVHSILQPDPRGQTYSTSYQTSQKFDDRDKEWVSKCQSLAFSGHFLFQICVSFMENEPANPDSDLRLQLPLQKLLDLNEKNIVENDLSHGRVFIAPHSAQTLGKADPLETHVKAFTCGHLFPKRVFDEEVVPEFEKRMNSLPMALYATKKAFAREFKRGASETPCPVCTFNKISPLVFQRYKTKEVTQQQGKKHEGSNEVSLRLRHHQEKQTQHLSYYFLHRETSERRLGFSAETHSSKPIIMKHEVWEWSDQRVS